ncbi:MAG: nuclear transport factor 2 family protein, partial [Myxococcota bacterium]
MSAFEARDWAALRTLAAEGTRFADRRRQALLSGDADWWVEDLELAAAYAEDVRFQRKLVATAGDRISLERVLLTGGPPAGRVEIEYFWLAEVDEAGLLVAGMMFDVDDWRAAQREGLGRWVARDTAAATVLGPVFELTEAWNDHDRARMRAVLADDFVLVDRRLAGVGEVEGVDAYLDSPAALWALAPDVQLEPRCVLVLERHGVVTVTRSFGTLSEGGAFERYLAVVATVARGRVTRLELFETDHVDAALVRLAELRPDPLRIPPNAATHASDRWAEGVAAGDMGSVEALFAPALVFEDRRRSSLLSGDREMLLANDRLLAASRPRSSRTVLATAGDHLALQHVAVTGTFEDAEFEAEYLRLVEVDSDGRLVAVIAFDPGERRAASVEMLEHFARSGVPPWLRSEAERRRTLLDHDVERLRA